MLPHIFSGLKVYVLQKSYVKTESSRDGIGGGEAALGSDCVRRVDPSGMDLVPYKRDLRKLSHPSCHARAQQENRSLRTSKVTLMGH